MNPPHMGTSRSKEGCLFNFWIASTEVRLLKPTKCIFSKLSCALHAVHSSPWSLLIDFLLHFLSSVSNLSTFFKIKSYFCLLSLFVYDLVLWLTMKIKAIWSTFFPYTAEVVFAYLSPCLLCLPFLVPFLFLSLSSFIFIELSSFPNIPYKCS